MQYFNQASMEFMDKVLDISGLGDSTYLPDGEACLAAACQ